MKEGWVEDDYLILFSQSEIPAVTDRYAFSHSLPGYQVLGLRGWDDFIILDSQRRTFSIPTVPLDPQYHSRNQSHSGRPLCWQDKVVRETRRVWW
jgi:hypothetical protein